MYTLGESINERTDCYRTKISQRSSICGCPVLGFG